MAISGPFWRTSDGCEFWKKEEASAYEAREYWNRQAKEASAGEDIPGSTVEKTLPGYTIDIPGSTVEKTLPGYTIDMPEHTRQIIVWGDVSLRDFILRRMKEG